MGITKNFVAKYGIDTPGKINKVTITAPTNAATLTLADGSSLLTSGAFSTTLTATANTVATLPSGTVTLPANNQTMYIGNTAVAINRSTGSLALTGITSIDGSAATLTTPRAISATGDASWTVNFDGSAAASAALTLTNTAVTAGSYGSGNTVPVITVDSKGRLTSVTTSAVVTPATSLSFTGDVTGTGSTGSATSLTLATTAVTAGSYGSATVVPVITVDSKGRLTAASNTSITSASTSTAGIVQLNDTVSSTSVTQAATANAVKTTYDLANSKLASAGGTISGDLVISGNVTVNGTTTTINATTVQVADNIIELRKGNSLAASDGGIQVNLTSDASGNITSSRSLKWVNTSSRFQLTNDGSTYSNVAVASDKLSTFAATTSSELAGVISDETGSGSLVFATSPTLVTPTVTTSIATGSASFDLVNTTATTVNFAGSGTAVSVGASTGNTTIKNNLVVTGNVSAPSSTATLGTLSFGDVDHTNIVSTISTNNTTVTLDTFSSTLYASVQYLVQVVRSTGTTEFNLTNLYLVQDGTNVYMTEYGQVSKSAMLGSFDATISTGNVVLQYSGYGDATVNNIKVKIARTAIKL